MAWGSAVKISQFALGKSKGNELRIMDAKISYADDIYPKYSWGFMGCMEMAEEARSVPR